VVSKKAISLLSGGLDSTLATRLVMDQGIEVVGLHFTSLFASKKEKLRGLQAVRTAEELGIRLLTVDKGDEFLEIVKKPAHGYGKNMNPCIDCRIFMLRKTKGMMEHEGAGFVITGEVLGQRPMSQRRETIALIERESGLASRILRPLSARLFPPSAPEMEGIVDREKLLNLSGRSRRGQYELVEKYGIKEFGYPGGGCLLTEPIFSCRLRDLFAHDPNFTTDDVALLSVGRHFRFGQETTLIVGRDQEENARLQASCPPSYVRLFPIGFKGPFGLLKGKVNAEFIGLAANIMARYGKVTEPAVQIESNDGNLRRHTVDRVDIDPDKFRIEEIQ
jgi:tRNA-specific 2-thiouridylase